MTIDELASLLLEPGPPVTADDVARFARRFDLFAPAALCTLLETRNGGHLSSFVTHGDFTLKSIFGLRDDDEILSLRTWFEPPKSDPDHLPIARCVRSQPVAARERCISIDRDGRIWCDSYFEHDGRHSSESIRLADCFDLFVSELRPQDHWELDHDLYRQAREFAKRGDADEALRTFHDSWNLHPHAATAHQIAELLLSRGQSAEALDWSSRSHEIARGRTGKYAVTHAQCLAQMGRRDEAIAVLEYIIQVNADYRPARRLLATLRPETGHGPG